MSARWLVHRHGQSFGPWSSGEVREELRKGTIDPFDLVSREGSQVMLELIEVDEIFQSEAVEYSTPDAATTVLALDLPQQQKTEKKIEEAGSFMALAEPNLASRIRSSVKQSAAHTRSGGAKKPKTTLFFKNSAKEKERAARKKSEGNISYELAKKSMSADIGQGATLKKYFLIDGKGRIFGPKSASEVQEMYYRGIIGSDVFVKKNQSETSVPVAKFAEIYAQAKGSKRSAPVIGNHPGFDAETMVGAPTSKFEMIGSHTAIGVKALQRSRYLVGVSGLILACAIGIGIYASKSALIVSQLTSSTNQNNSQQVAKLRKKRTRKKLARQKAKPRTVVRKAKPKPAVARKPQVKKLAAKKAPANRSAFARRKFTPSKRTTRRSNRVTPIRSKRSRRGLSALATIKASRGKVVTAGPLKFNPAELNSCTLKCSIRMVDSAGLAIEVKFFRAAFGNRLVGKSSKIYITGRVAPNAKSLFLQDVK